MKLERPSDEPNAEPEVTASDSSADVSPTAMGQEGMGVTLKPMEMCPMAAMCQGMMGTKGGGISWLVLVPGAALVVGGVLIILVPQILVWLVGLTSIVLGGMFLLIARGSRKFAAGVGQPDG